MYAKYESPSLTTQKLYGSLNKCWKQTNRQTNRHTDRTKTIMYLIYQCMGIKSQSWVIQCYIPVSATVCAGTWDIVTPPSEICQSGSKIGTCTWFDLIYDTLPLTIFVFWETSIIKIDVQREGRHHHSFLVSLCKVECQRPHGTGCSKAEYHSRCCVIFTWAFSSNCCCWWYIECNCCLQKYMYFHKLSTESQIKLNNVSYLQCVFYTKDL